jgi:hypothetical protein
MLSGLVEAGIEFIVVGGAAGVMLGAPIVTMDLDIVHRRTPENVDLLLSWLLRHGAFHRFDLANRRLPSSRELLLGQGHLNLQTDWESWMFFASSAPASIMISYSQTRSS